VDNVVVMDRDESFEDVTAVFEGFALRRSVFWEHNSSQNVSSLCFFKQ